MPYIRKPTAIYCVSLKTSCPCRNTNFEIFLEAFTSKEKAEKFAKEKLNLEDHEYVIRKKVLN